MTALARQKDYSNATISNDLNDYKYIQEFPKSSSSSSTSTNSETSPPVPNDPVTTKPIKCSFVVPMCHTIGNKSNPPLHGAEKFEELKLHADILKGIYSMGFTRPLEIQKRALPVLLHNPPQNMILQWQHGTGKTTALVLTMLSRVDVSLNKVQALCMTSSWKSAHHIGSIIASMGKFSKLRTEYALNMMEIVTGRPSSVTSHIVIGTPGTILGLIERKTIDTGEIKIFALDEADDILTEDGLDDKIMRGRSALPHPVQILLFSSTLPDRIRSFTAKFAPYANKMEFRKEVITVTGTRDRQIYMNCHGKEHKYDVLAELLSVLTTSLNWRWIIVFCRYRNTADRIMERITTERIKAVSLHRAKDLGERHAIITNFRAQHDNVRVLVTTDSIVQGTPVDLVVNYDLPLMNEYSNDWRPDLGTYVRRLGQTAAAEQYKVTGPCINLIHNEITRQQLEIIKRALGVKIERCTL